MTDQPQYSKTEKALGLVMLASVVPATLAAAACVVRLYEIFAHFIGAS